MRDEDEVQAEYARALAAIPEAGDETNYRGLAGIAQALAWVLSEAWRSPMDWAIDAKALASQKVGAAAWK